MAYIRTYRDIYGSECYLQESDMSEMTVFSLVIRFLLVPLDDGVEHTQNSLDLRHYTGRKFVTLV